ncbi:Potassium voltage-gated channel sub H member 7 [Rhizophlyctis rosea]|nr:Potassium voltage-gated channel sub H member 7 [Rhizophlyctis rosea]
MSMYGQPNLVGQQSGNNLANLAFPPPKREIPVERVMSGLEPLEGDGGPAFRLKQNVIRNRSKAVLLEGEKSMTWSEPRPSKDVADHVFSELVTPADSLTGSRDSRWDTAERVSIASDDIPRGQTTSASSEPPSTRDTAPKFRGRSLSAKVAQTFLRKKSGSESPDVPKSEKLERKDSLEAMMDGEVKGREGGASRIIGTQLASPRDSQTTPSQLPALPQSASFAQSISRSASFAPSSIRASNGATIVPLKPPHIVGPALSLAMSRQNSSVLDNKAKSRQNSTVLEHVKLSEAPKERTLWQGMVSAGRKSFLLPQHVDAGSVEAIFGIATTVVYALDITRLILTAAPMKEDRAQPGATSKSMMSLSLKDQTPLGLLKSKKKYLRSWFIVEFVATLPMDLIVAHRLPHYNDIFLLMRFLRLPRLRSLIRDSPIWKKAWQIISSTLGVSEHTFAVLYEYLDFTPYLRPADSAQQWLIVVFVIAGAILYAIIVGTISSFSFGLDASGRLYNQKLDEVNEYLRYKDVPQETRKKVFQYYQVKYHGKFFEEGEILGQLNEALRMEIAIHNCKELIMKVPFLQRDEGDGRDAIFMGRIASALQSCYYVKGDVVCAQGESGDAMYFILHGTVGILVNGNPVASLQAGSFFGEVALIAQIPRTATVIARTACHLYRLARSDFLQILETFDDMRMRIDRIYQERMKKVRLEEEAKRASEEEEERRRPEDAMAESDEEGEDGADIAAVLAASRSEEIVGSAGGRQSGGEGENGDLGEARM